MLKPAMNPFGGTWKKDLACLLKPRIDAYLAARARGLKEKDQPLEKAQLIGYLNELAHPHQVTVKRFKYWTLQGYALAHRIKQQGFYKIFRRLEETAEDLFPDKVPPYRCKEIRNADLRQRRAAAVERRHWIEEVEKQMAAEQVEQPARMGFLPEDPTF